MDIKETIIVEGKDDKSAVLAAVNANVICTSGYGLNDDILRLIEAAYEKTGIIIFTDPDHAGSKIRERLKKQFPNAKECFLTKEQSFKKGDIGIENASPDDIRKALLKSCSVKDKKTDIFTMEDMLALGLAGSKNSSERRAALGANLGIGSANVKSFLKRLNYFGISKEELEKLL